MYVYYENYHYKEIEKYEYASWSVMHCLQKPKAAIWYLSIIASKTNEITDY